MTNTLDEPVEYWMLVVKETISCQAWLYKQM